MQEPQTGLTSPTCRTPPGQKSGHPPDSSRADLLHPGFDATLLSNDTSTAIPENQDCAPSSRSPPDASRAPFPHRSPRRSSANAACGGLPPPSARAAAKGHTFISCTAPSSRSSIYKQNSSMFVAHVGSQILCHSPTSPTSGVAGCLSRCPRQFVSNGCPFCSTAFFVGTARSRGPAQRRWARAAIRHCDTDLDRPSEATRRLKWKADRTRCRVSDRGSKVRFGALIPKRMCRKGAVSQYCDCFF